jgi:putative transcriptional regulator
MPGVEALVAIRKVTWADVVFGAKESSVEAYTASALDCQRDEQIPSLLNRLESEGLKYSFDLSLA